MSPDYKVAIRPAPEQGRAPRGNLKGVSASTYATVREIVAVGQELGVSAARLMADLMYGAGLRVTECERLRIKDVDFGNVCRRRQRQGCRTWQAGIATTPARASD
jgi:integrase